MTIILKEGMVPTMMMMMMMTMTMTMMALAKMTEQVEGEEMIVRHPGEQPGTDLGTEVPEDHAGLLTMIEIMMAITTTMTMKTKKKKMLLLHQMKAVTATIIIITEVKQKKKRRMTTGQRTMGTVAVAADQSTSITPEAEA